LQTCAAGRIGLAAIPQAQRRVKDHFAPAHQLQLLQGIGVIAGFADLQAVQRGDLVRTDHQGWADPGGNGGGLLARQPQGCRFRRFAGLRGFVDVRGHGFEGQAEPAQQFLAIDGTGAQDQAGQGGIGAV
jgi:hypothetical protein